MTWWNRGDGKRGKFKKITFSSVQSLSCVQLFGTPWITAHQAYLSITNSQVHSDSRPSSQWCHPAISSSVVSFSSCPQSLPASASFPISQLFPWGSQSIRVSAYHQSFQRTPRVDLLLNGLVGSPSKGRSTVQKHQFFGAQPSSQSNSHIHTWPQEKP